MALLLKYETLEEFYLFSGLQPNLGKSALFYAGVSDSLKDELSGILSIPVGYLPIKYLGVPLITTELKYSDFILPRKIIKEIESLLSSYLWRGILEDCWCQAELATCLYFEERRRFRS